MNEPPANSRKPVPRGCVLLIGFAFLLSGIAGLAVVVTQLLLPTVKVRSWPPVPCTVLRAETVPKGMDLQGHYRMEVLAELVWEYNGTRYTGGRLDAETGFQAAESVNTKEELCHRLRQSPQQTCYVNPDKPSEAILRRPEWWPVFIFSTGGVVFLGAGTGILYAMRRRKSRPAPAWLAPGFAVLLGLMLFSGGFSVWWYTIRGTPDWKAIAARMKEVPCTVAGSAVQTNSGGGRQSSTTHSPFIVFRYDWDGRTWHSSWFNFRKTAPGSSDRSEAEATVARFRRGSTHTCWVDPDQPWVAVLEKSGHGFAWQWIAVVLFVLIGGVFTFAVLRKLWRSAAAESRRGI
jgi:hypothetical protein